MACTCRSTLNALRQPTRRIAQTPFALLSARPLSSSATVLNAKPASSSPGAAAAAASSCPPGTVLKGLNYLKDGQDPVALEDSEYPAWVFALPTSKATAVKGDKGDPAAELRKQRVDLKKKTKAGIKASNDLKG
ncbi:hypothetical protein JCM3775_003973 [Rhodotorula graminis]|uniref:Large ribosomal subunit protein mL54 n=1 Tax=Rhodotorula graminis (strain WP1) TaxID=578459 RepID=A0A0P9ELQ3_RHOGW|nr:uncharacterized protein RHOBADRAFT_46727 [Rhodotorula graminis WP1]KPV72683.1 hypothetical protein RHOBADRAFT_46727 [Rhodotorula graminis WP1]